MSFLKSCLIFLSVNILFVKSASMGDLAMRAKVDESDMTLKQFSLKFEKKCPIEIDLSKLEEEHRMAVMDSDKRMTFFNMRMVMDFAIKKFKFDLRSEYQEKCRIFLGELKEFHIGGFLTLKKELQDGSFSRDLLEKYCKQIHEKHNEICDKSNILLDDLMKKVPGFENECMAMFTTSTTVEQLSFLKLEDSHDPRTGETLDQKFQLKRKIEKLNEKCKRKLAKTQANFRSFFSDNFSKHFEHIQHYLKEISESISEERLLSLYYTLINKFESSMSSFEKKIERMRCDMEAESLLLERKFKNLLQVLNMRMEFHVSLYERFLISSN